MGKIVRRGEDGNQLEPALASYLYYNSLHKEMSDALAVVLANKLGRRSCWIRNCWNCFRSVTGKTRRWCNARLQICKRFGEDPACDKYVMILLYFKGFRRCKRRGLHILVVERKTVVGIVVAA